MLLKIPESSWLPTNTNLNHMSTISNYFFFLYSSTVKVWQDVCGSWRQTWKIIEKTAFLKNKLFHFLTECFLKNKIKNYSLFFSTSYTLHSVLKIYAILAKLFHTGIIISPQHNGRYILIRKTKIKPSQKNTYAEDFETTQKTEKASQHPLKTQIILNTTLFQENHN